MPALENVQVWRIALDLPADQVSSLRRFLSQEDQARSARFRMDHLRRRFIVSHAAMRIVLANTVGCQPEELMVETNPYGKPTICYPRTRPAIEFNLSHSGELALLAVGVENPIGIDLERLRPLPSLQRLTERYFSPTEQQLVLSASAEEQTQLFFRLWTLKEALLKALGTGLIFPLDALTFGPTEQDNLALQSFDSSVARRHNLAVNQWSTCEFVPQENYVAALAVKGKLQKIDFYIWQPPDRSRLQ